MPAEWRSDLRRLVRIIDSVHPWPWRRISSDAFHSTARQLVTEIHRLRSDQVVARMMQLVAMLHDGHTTLYPSGRAGFDRWFPVRLYRFADSLTVTAVDSDHAWLAGARVLRVGGVDALTAAARMASLSGADNPFGARQSTGLLSNAPATRALGLSDGQTLDLQVRTAGGETRQVLLRAVVTQWSDPAWMQRGEMFGPPGVPVITAFGRKAPLDYRRMSPDLPLHLRNRIPIWFTRLPDSVLYVQSNFIQDFNGTSFTAVVDSVFATVDAYPTRRLVLDLRYNSGGDGSKVQQFVHDIIRRPVLDQAGSVVVLIGGKTFSAAVLWLSELREHTSVITVGEPAGAPRNHSGDAGTFTLPASGLSLQVSTLRHYGTRSDDTSRVEVPDFPVAMTAADYFRGDDPALALARSREDLRSIPSIAAVDGAANALAELRRREARFGRTPDWRAFDEREMNTAGYDLFHGARMLDALAVFRANTEAYPTSANVWDSYGEALLAHGDTAAAVASYRRAVERDPGNENARRIVQRLGGG